MRRATLGARSGLLSALWAVIAVSSSASAEPPSGPGPRIYESTGQFRLAIPEGFSVSSEPPAPPIAAVFSRAVPGGEKLLIVERYDAESGATPEAFVHNLRPNDPPVPVRRKSGGKAYDLYEGLRLESFTGRLPAQDPYAEALGSDPPPPRLNYLDSRRFPPGGEAYKLYRCRERGMWGLLQDYRKARKAGTEALSDFRKTYFDDAARKAARVCFGDAVPAAVDRGDEVAPIAKPGLFRLRMLAREEFRSGAAKRIERESLYVLDGPRGFYVLRLRAPGDAYRKDDPAFLAFIAGFRVLE